MPKVIWSKRARRDLVELAVYSDNQFGVKQRKSYLAQLHTHLANVSKRPLLDRAHPGKHEGLSKTRFKANMIFYERNEDGGINIVCVLGSRMDFDRHL